MKPVLRAICLYWALCCTPLAFANPITLSDQDRATMLLENRVADDPRAALKEADAELAKAADKRDKLKALRLKVLAHYQMEDTRRMVEAADAGLPLARDLSDHHAECEFLVVKGSKLATEGKYREARQLYEQASELAKQHGLKRTATAIDVAKAFDLSILGRDADAIKMLSEAHQNFVDMGDAPSARGTLAAMGNAYVHENASVADLRKAVDFFERSVPPDAERNRRHELATTFANLGSVYHRLKDWSKSRAYLERSSALYAVLGDANGEAFAAYRIGLVLADSGKFREALERQDKALVEFETNDDATMRFNVHRARARVLAELDRKRESLDALATAEKLANGSESAWVKQTFLSDAARIYARVGEFDLAYKTMVALRDVEQADARSARAREEEEFKTRFEVKQKDAENELLRARAEQADARRLVLVLTIALLALVLGGLAWFVVRQSHQSQRFASLALRDDLTGLPNRRAIIEFAREQHRKAASDRSKLAIALIDIDHFKSINDRFGHAVGDRVLASFAAICQQQLRSNDRIGRYGGEEFMLVMPGSDAGQAPQVFTRLRLAMRQLEAEGFVAHQQVTFSMGASEVKGMSDGLEAVIKRADEALYRAKQGGRDRSELG
jgi:diguanylate cyclase (GGDEF)-like protein